MFVIWSGLQILVNLVLGFELLTTVPVSSLFAIGDNLERALAACADEKTRQGVEMVLKSYKKVLEGENVEEIDPTGQPFDASFAEAIMAVAPEEGEEHGVVKQVYEKGYKRGDKVLRYAKVIVTQ